MNASQPIPPATPAPSVPVAVDELDRYAVIGILVGAAAVTVTLLFSVMIPFFSWIAAGLLGIPTIGLGIASRSPIRRWIIAAGCCAMIPVIILAFIQLFLGRIIPGG